MVMMPRILLTAWCCCYAGGVDRCQQPIPTPAGTRAGIDERWVTVPATGRRHGRRHDRATEPIAKGLQHRSQVIIHTAAGLVTHTTTFPELTLRELRPVRVPSPHGFTITAGVASLRPA